MTTCAACILLDEDETSAQETPCDEENTVSDEDEDYEDDDDDDDDDDDEDGGALAASSSGAGSLQKPRKRDQRAIRKIHQELEKLDDLHKSMALYRKQITKMMAQVKKSSTTIHKELQTTDEKRSISGARRGGGLCTPFVVSSSLCAFMDIPTGTRVARAQVTKYLHGYIKQHDLYDGVNRQYIIPDTTLQQLLSTSTRVHIFDIQSKMNQHFHYGTKAASGSGGAA